jgi:hypothetical protein
MLWADTYFDGQIIQLGQAAISSQRLSKVPAFYLQDLSSDSSFGLRVDLHGAVNLWPPSIGSVVEIAGTVAYVDGAPRLSMSANEDGNIVGYTELITSEAFENPPLHSLVSLPSVRVSSRTDPAGRADTDQGLGLESAFGVVPPNWDNSGELIGIVTHSNLVSLRHINDWNGPNETYPPLSTTIEEVSANLLEEGTPITLEALQASPWSVDQRSVVLQDDDGRGIWVDAEYWAWERSPEQSRGLWTAEVRGEGSLLRVWDAPELSGFQEPLTSTNDDNGSIIQHTITILDQPDVNGNRLGNDYLIDDRFMAIEHWTPPLTVRGAIQRVPSEAMPRLCPLERL